MTKRKFKRIRSHGKWVFYIKDGTKEFRAEQVRDIKDYLGKGNWIHKKTYTELHSHNPHHMPQLELAIKYCIENNASFVASYFGTRLKNLKFIDLAYDAQVNHGIKIYGLNSMSDRLDMRTLYAVSEEHRAQVSANTKAALAKLKKKGVKLGNPNIEKATAISVVSHTRNRLEFAKKLAPVVKQIQQFGDTSLSEIAKALNHRGIKTRYRPHKSKWHPSNVSNLLRSIEEAKRK